MANRVMAFRQKWNQKKLYCKIRRKL